MEGDESVAPVRPRVDGRTGSAPVLSVAAPTAEVRPVRLSQAEIAQSNASEIPFGLGTSETIHSGSPVAEQLTTRYNDGSTQTESLVEVPNIANHSVTTYKTINLRNNGGTETMVDTETFSRGRLAADGIIIPFTGTDRTHNITTTLPNGSTSTETETELITGPKTVVNGTINEASGGVEIWTAVKIKTGPTTVSNKTIREADGSVEHQKITTTKRGEFDSTVTTTTILPDGTVQRSSSATDVTRVQTPSS